MSEIIHLPQRRLDPDQKEYFHSQAAYWEEVIDMATRQLEYAQSQREYSLRMLGMLAVQGGYPE